MIVSKKFFNEAVYAWFYKATLQFPSEGALDKFVHTLNVTPISGITTVHVAWDCHKF